MWLKNKQYETEPIKQCLWHIKISWPSTFFNLFHKDSPKLSRYRKRWAGPAHQGLNWAEPWASDLRRQREELRQASRRGILPLYPLNILFKDWLTLERSFGRGREPVCSTFCCCFSKRNACMWGLVVAQRAWECVEGYWNAILALMEGI